jgi:hypothetical protein
MSDHVPADPTATPSRDLVIPTTGILVDLDDEVSCAEAIDDLRLMKARIDQAIRTLQNAVAERAAVLGLRSIRLPRGRKANLSSPVEKVYDCSRIEAELREAGMPEERIREIVLEEVSYKLDVREANRAAKANPTYAEIIGRNTTEQQRAVGVTIRSR